VSNHELNLAVHCQYLRRAIAPGQAESILTLCQHPIREGKECVGPFLEDLATNCGLWEPHPQRELIPPPQPERWQRRRRREGFDFQRAFRDDWR
jgi:hypothetical protein